MSKLSTKTIFPNPRNIVAACIMLLMFCSLSYQSSAQVFWTETFDTTTVPCDQTKTANLSATSNGTWTVSPTGANDGFANEWYMSASEAGSVTGAGHCTGNSCAVDTTFKDRTLHIGNVASSPNSAACTSGDCGATYDFGVGAAQVSTSKRAESPFIDCSFKSNISLKFNYAEGGDNIIDNGTVEYYDGTTCSCWTTIDDPTKTIACSALTGEWSQWTVALPPSANNNQYVKIGFTWVNNDDASGPKHSFAIDSVILFESTSLPVIANFSASDTAICEGDAISFTDLSTGSPTTWEWSFPGGTPSSSTSQNPTGITYTIAGDYDVQLIVMNASDTDTLVMTQYIHVTACALPVADFMATDTTLCENDCINFMDMSVGATSWQWLFTGGNPPSATVQSPTNVCYSVAGNYDVVLVATNTNGSDTLIKSVYINVTACTIPIADFIESDTSICIGDTISFTDISTGGPTSWQWSFFGGTPSASSAQNPSPISYSTPGDYDIQLVVSNSFGSDTVLKAMHIHVSACTPPTALFVVSADTICENSCVSFADSSINGATSWQWLFPGATPGSSTFQNPTNICYGNYGNYPVTLIVSNAYGIDSLTQFNYVNVVTCPVPQANFAVSDSLFCSNLDNCVTYFDLSVNMDTANGPLQWLWILPGATPDTVFAQFPTNVCYNQDGSYTAILIATNKFGSDTMIVDNLVNVVSVPSAFTYGDTAIYFGESHQLFAYADSALSYHWEPSESLDSANTNHPIATPMETTTYTVTINDSSGCQTTREVTVEVLHVSRVFVPNTFAPRGEGNNQYVHVNGNNINTMLFAVYDRWGEKVFESTAASIGWDGTYKGKPLNAGVFVYTLHVEFTDGKDYNGTGNITLIR